eukprot:5393592-Pleurochrysis_carterae.AAC.1
MGGRAPAQQQVQLMTPAPVVAHEAARQPAKSRRIANVRLAASKRFGTANANEESTQSTLAQ